MMQSVIAHLQMPLLDMLLTRVVHPNFAGLNKVNLACSWQHDTNSCTQLHPFR